MVNLKALKILDKICQPVVLVAITGQYQTGKYYLMNGLAGQKHEEYCPHGDRSHLLGSRDNTGWSHFLRGHHKREPNPSHWKKFLFLTIKFTTSTLYVHKILFFSLVKNKQTKKQNLAPIKYPPHLSSGSHPFSPAQELPFFFLYHLCPNYSVIPSSTTF